MSTPAAGSSIFKTPERGCPHPQQVQTFSKPRCSRRREEAEALKPRRIRLLTSAATTLREDFARAHCSSLFLFASFRVFSRNDAEETTDGHGFTRMELSQDGDGSAKPGPSFGGRSWTSKNPGSIRVHRCSSVFIRVHPCSSVSIRVHPCPSVFIRVHPCPSVVSSASFRLTPNLNTLLPANRYRKGPEIFTFPPKAADTFNRLGTVSSPVPGRFSGQYSIISHE